MAKLSKIESYCWGADSLNYFETRSLIEALETWNGTNSEKLKQVAERLRMGLSEYRNEKAGV